MSGRRPGAVTAAVPPGAPPNREVAVLEELERCAAAGGQVVDPVRQSELSQSGGAVSSAHDREAGGVRHRLGHGPRPRREARILEDAHGPVPEDGTRLGDGVGVGGRRSRSDVEPFPPVRHVGADLTHLTVQAERPVRSVGSRMGRSALEQSSAALQVIRLEERVPDAMALGGQEGEAHPSAHHQGIDPIQQRLDNAELVADLGAAQTATKGRAAP